MAKCPKPQSWMANWILVVYNSRSHRSTEWVIDLATPNSIAYATSGVFLAMRRTSTSTLSNAGFLSFGLKLIRRLMTKMVIDEIKRFVYDMKTQKWRTTNLYIEPADIIITTKVCLALLCSRDASAREASIIILYTRQRDSYVSYASVNWNCC